MYYLKNLTSWLRPAFSCLLLLASGFAMAEEKSVIIIQEEDEGPIPEVEVYNRMLPIWGAEAVALGHEIPKPFGFSVIYMDLSQPLEVENIGFSGLSNNSLGLGLKDDGLNIQTEVAEQKGKNITFRADMWLLPFLNVYAVLGKTEGTSRTTITNIEYSESCQGLPPLQYAACVARVTTVNGIVGLIPEGTPFNLNYDGGTYGLGSTIAGGVGNWFAMTDMNYTYTTLNILDGKISTFVMSPRVGYRFKVGAVESRVWVGAMYQDVQQNFTGDISGILPELDGLLPDSKFHVSQRLIERWNGTAGAMFEINRSFEFLFEFGFGDRTSAMGSLGYRF